MAHDHEYITQYGNDIVGLFNTCVFEAVIIQVNNTSGKIMVYDDHPHYIYPGHADINVTNPLLGQYNDILIFYHCPGSSVIEGGSVAFKSGDRVIVLCRNCKGNLFPQSAMKIVGFIDGLKSCNWRFKLFRDDDTTIRNPDGSIKTPSGIPIDLYKLNSIVIESDTTYASLPGNYGWAAAYWNYDSVTGIWTYDDSSDHPDDWRKGTYDTNTEQFTVELMEKSGDGLYWVSYSCPTPIIKTDPAINAAVSTSVIDSYAGVIIKLTEAGKEQTLQDPTHTIAGKPFTVMASESNGSHTIEINNIVFSAGDSQDFEWNGSAWIVSSENNMMFGLNIQYPYIYKSAEKNKYADQISVGMYEGNIPYWKESDQYYSPEPNEISGYTCNPSDGFAVDIVTKNGFVVSQYSRMNKLKSSIPYYIRRSITYPGWLSVVCYPLGYAPEIIDGLGSTCLAYSCSNPEVCRSMGTISYLWPDLKYYTEDNVFITDVDFVYYHSPLPRPPYEVIKDSLWESRPNSIALEIEKGIKFVAEHAGPGKIACFSPYPECVKVNMYPDISCFQIKNYEHFNTDFRYEDE